MAAGSELARRLDAAALSLTYGRDLLHTHLARGPRGGMRFRSEWGSILTTPRVRWALFAEMGSLARQLAPLGGQLGHSARGRGSPTARQAINDGCHWLEIMGTSIRSAHHDRPLSAADLELLRAVPAGACLPRWRPDTGEPVRRMPEAVVATAERARHAAWLSDSQQPWPPGMSVNSLRQTAAASTLTSQHCEILLRSLARRQRIAGEPGIALLAAADAAGRTRSRWLGIAHALDQVASANQDQPAPVAIAAGDLALWTGRLAYSDPGWTLASGPAPAGRPGEHPREPGEMTEVLAAVHDACGAMSRIASADRRQVHALAAAGQVLVTAGPEPGTLDMLGPLAPARPDRIGALLTLYQYTAQASAEATTTVSVAATATRVPHRTVFPATHAGHRREPVAPPEAAEQIAGAQSLYEPGRIERTLRGLGVTDINLLRRGGEIDRAAEQLIIHATTERESRSPERSTARMCVPADENGDRHSGSTGLRSGQASGASPPSQAQQAEAEA